MTREVPHPKVLEDMLTTSTRYDVCLGIASARTAMPIPKRKVEFQEPPIPTPRRNSEKSSRMTLQRSMPGTLFKACSSARAAYRTFWLKRGPSLKLTQTTKPKTQPKPKRKQQNNSQPTPTTNQSTWGNLGLFEPLNSEEPTFLRTYIRKS